MRGLLRSLERELDCDTMRVNDNFILSPGSAEVGLHTLS